MSRTGKARLKGTLTHSPRNSIGHRTPADCMEMEARHGIFVGQDLLLPHCVTQVETFNHRETHVYIYVK